MASTVLVRDALWRVSVMLADTRPQFQRWTEAELVDHLNDAQLVIADLLPMSCARVDAVRLVPGTRQSIDTFDATNCIPGDGTTMTQPVHGRQLLDVIRNMGADGQTPGRAVRVIDRRTLDSQAPQWHRVQGAQVSAYMYDPRTPKVWYVTPAVPPGTPVWVEISYIANPVRIPAPASPGAYAREGGSTQRLSIADEFLVDLVNYVVARAHLKDAKFGDPSKAVTYANLFVSAMNAKVQALTGHNPNLQRLPLAPEPMGAAS